MVFCFDRIPQYALFETVYNVPYMFLFVHVDVIDYDYAAQTSQSYLSAYFIRGFKVTFKYCLFLVLSGGILPGIDIYRSKGFRSLILLKTAGS